MAGTRNGEIITRRRVERIHIVSNMNYSFIGPRASTRLYRIRLFFYLRYSLRLILSWFSYFSIQWKSYMFLYTRI